MNPSFVVQAKVSRNDPFIQKLIGRLLDRLLERVEGTIINHKPISANKANFASVVTRGIHGDTNYLRMRLSLVTRKVDSVIVWLT